MPIIRLPCAFCDCLLFLMRVPLPIWWASIARFYYEQQELDVSEELTSTTGCRGRDLNHRLLSPWASPLPLSYLATANRLKSLYAPHVQSKNHKKPFYNLYDLYSNQLLIRLNLLVVNSQLPCTTCSALITKNFF